MSQQTPALTSTDPLDPSFDPYAAWAEVRDDQPVQRIEAFGQPIYVILNHELVERILRDNITFSSRSNAEGIGQVMGPMIVGMDGDEHRRYRDIVARAFRPTSIQRWERETAEPIIQGLLDEIAPRGMAELVADVTCRFPVRVIAAMLGVPVDDFETVHHWAEQINLGPADLSRSLPAAKALGDYLTPIVEDRRAHPQDDLVSDIVTAEVDGQHLDDEHIYGFLRLLFPAGAETTFRTFGSALYALLHDPAVLERVNESRELIPQLAEETLRWETAVTVLSRVTTQEVELGGVLIPAGTALLVSTGAANRDPAHVEEPDRWDPFRPPQNHLAFGTGRHQCLGMHLARMELRVGLNAVLDRLPNLRLDPDEPAPHMGGFAFRGPDRLPVLFDPS